MVGCVAQYGRDQECVQNVDRIIWSGGIFGKN